LGLKYKETSSNSLENTESYRNVYKMNNFSGTPSIDSNDFIIDAIHPANDIFDETEEIPGFAGPGVVIQRILNMSEGGRGGWDPVSILKMRPRPGACAW